MLVIFLIPSIEASRRNFAEAELGRPARRECRIATISGEVAAGQAWSASIGRGWMLRMAPIPASGRGYSGWDLVVSLAGDDSYPDALLLATPPYGSLNEREIGTTYGMRAQDAIAWTPRRFRFFTTAAQLRRARKLYRQVMPESSEGGKKEFFARSSADRTNISGELLEMLSRESELGSGEFSVLDARLAAGTADPAAFARQWAMQLGRVPHTIEQNGDTPTARGKLLWVRFRVTMRLPAPWKLPPEWRSEAAKCAE